MDANKQLEALHDIRNMMRKSSRFISLSGFSGVIVGVLALCFGWYILSLVAAFNAMYDTSLDYCSLLFHNGVLRLDLLYRYGILALVLLAASLGISLILTIRKAKREGEPLWDENAKRLLYHLFVPLGVGGLICLVFAYHLQLYFIAPMMLVFYGFALYNTSKYTLNEIHSLGLINMVLGLLAMFFVRWGLFIWMFGFGFMHIVYGIWMYAKYDRIK